MLIDFVTTLARVLTAARQPGGRDAVWRPGRAPIPARGGRDQVLRLIERSARRPAPAARRGTDLAPLLEAGAGDASSAGRSVVVVSDFISQPGWERPLSLLARRHEVARHPALGPAGRSSCRMSAPLVMEDAETGEQL